MMRRSTGAQGRFGVLIATDGSPSALAALMTASVFPWPRGTQVKGVVALRTGWLGGKPHVRAALERHFGLLAAKASRALKRHWPDAETITVKQPPVQGILHEAERFAANVIVVGWRGHGTFRRLLMGSVSRGVVARARAAVLVVRRRARQVRRAVIGIDGSPHARRAVELAARFDGDRKGTITVVRIVERIALPTAGLLPASVRVPLIQSAARLNNELIQRAQRDVDSAAARLRRAGWTVRKEVRRGAPLAELLGVVDHSRCHVLILGARGTSGFKRALLGCVAEGARNRSSVPVLVVR